MGSAIGLREDFDGVALRRLSRTTKSANQTRRLLALAEILLLPRGPNQFEGAFWLKPEFDAIQTERRAAVDKNDYLRIAGLPQRYKQMILHDPFLVIVRDWLSRSDARMGFEHHWPMYSRRFIEYSFATPERLRFDGNIRKWTHSRALADVLPDKVLNRRTKADFSVAFSARMPDVVDRVQQ